MTTLQIIVIVFWSIVYILYSVLSISDVIYSISHTTENIHVRIEWYTWIHIIAHIIAIIVLSILAFI